MHSRARLTYTQVWHWLSEPGSAKARRREARCCRISQNLYALYQGAAQAAREARGAIDFDTVELALEFDDQRQDRARSCRSSRNDAHKLIEECMLAANVCTARVPRRSTSSPRSIASTKARRRTSSRRCASSSRARRCRWPAATSPRRPTTRSCSTRSRDRPDFALLQTVLLRSLSAGAIPARQRRPLRPRLRRLRALHVADPALSGSARAPRDQGGAGGQALHSRRAHRGRRWACTAR